MPALVAGLLFLLLTLPLRAGAEWQPDSDSPLEQRSAAAVSEFQEREALQPYFQEAAAFAVFPGITRGGFILGGASGKGLLVEGDTLAGVVRQFRLSVGPQFGYQNQSQIIFFRTAAAAEEFRAGRTEFNGAAGLAAGAWGTSITPAWVSDVAVFAQTQFGLMVEASLAGTRFRFEPLGED